MFFSARAMFAEVVPLHSSLSDRGLTYRVPEGFSDLLRAGTLVEIPLRDAAVEGIVSGVFEESGASDGSGEGVRDILRVLSGEPVVTPSQLATVHAVSARSYVPVHRALGIVLPAPVVARIRRGKYELGPLPDISGRQWTETLHFFPDSVRLTRALFESVAPGTAVIWPDDRTLFAAVGGRSLPDSHAVVPTGAYSSRRATVYRDAWTRRAPVLHTTRRGVFLPIESYDRVLYVEEALVPRYTAFRRDYRYADWLSIHARHAGLAVEWHSVAPTVERMYSAVVSASLVTHS